MPFDETPPEDFFDLGEERLREIAQTDPADGRQRAYRILLRIVRVLQDTPEVPANSAGAPFDSELTAPWLDYFKRRHGLSVKGLAAALKVTEATAYGWKTRGRLSAQRRKQLRDLAAQLSLKK